MTNTIVSERLRERAKVLFSRLLTADTGYIECDNVDNEQAVERIATALYEIEQAARAEGERAGLERAAGLAAVIVTDSEEANWVAERIRALPIEDTP